MLDDPTIALAHRTIAEPPPNAHRDTSHGARAAGARAGRSTTGFPLRLEISPLTIRRPKALDADDAQVC
jgi:hypothetical protein